MDTAAGFATGSSGGNAAGCAGEYDPGGRLTGSRAQSRG